jgi:hypothetical protein
MDAELDDIVAICVCIQAYIELNLLRPEAPSLKGTDAVLQILLPAYMFDVEKAAGKRSLNHGHLRWFSTRLDNSTYPSDVEGSLLEDNELALSRVLRDGRVSARFTF